MTIGRGTKARELHDGAGLCSPGRWIPEQRKLPENEIVEKFSQKIKKPVTERLFSDLFAELACGRVKDCPFEDLEKSGKSVSAVREARSRSQEKTSRDKFTSGVQTTGELSEMHRRPRTKCGQLCKRSVRRRRGQDASCASRFPTQK